MLLTTGLYEPWGGPPGGAMGRDLSPRGLAGRDGDLTNAVACAWFGGPPNTDASLEVLVGHRTAAAQLSQCGHPCCERSIGLPAGSQTRDSASRLGGLFLTSVAAPHCLHTGTRASTLSTSKPKWLIPSLS